MTTSASSSVVVVGSVSGGRSISAITNNVSDGRISALVYVAEPIAFNRLFVRLARLSDVASGSMRLQVSFNREGGSIVKQFVFDVELNVVRGYENFSIASSQYTSLTLDLPEGVVLPSGMNTLVLSSPSLNGSRDFLAAETFDEPFKLVSLLQKAMTYYYIDGQMYGGLYSLNFKCINDVGDSSGSGSGGDGGGSDGGDGGGLGGVVDDIKDAVDDDTPVKIPVINVNVSKGDLLKWLLLLLVLLLVCGGLYYYYTKRGGKKK